MLIPNFPAAFEREHMAWHMGAMDGFPGRRFPSGSPGSGREFLQFHRGFVGRAVTWYASQPGADVSLVTPWREVPQALKQARFGWSALWANQEAQLRNPSRTTFPTDDALGRFIENGIHNNFLHGAAAAAFGEPIVAGFSSPRSTIFYQIHGLVEFWWMLWQNADQTVPEPPEPIDLVVDASALSLAIGQTSDIDRFRLVVAQLGTYRIGTEGGSDLVMSLYSASNPTTPMASDDNSGPGTNPRIDIELAPGTYELRVMHVSSQGTGNYTIRATRRQTTPQPQTPELVVNAAATQAAIGAAGEVDLYRFQAPSTGAYRIATQGPTDVFMTLLGPNTQNTQITADDDSGPGLNALIVRNLGAGTYFVQVRHFDRQRTGPYSISVGR